MDGRSGQALHQGSAEIQRCKLAIGERLFSRPFDRAVKVSARGTTVLVIDEGKRHLLGLDYVLRTTSPM